MARMPTPPQAVIPPEGLEPPPQATEPTASPTTMVLNYLNSRGYPPTSENVRRALQANAVNPGLIPGLRSDTAATEEEDQAAMRAAGRGRGGGRALPIPPKPPGGSGTVPMDNRNEPATSAGPSPTQVERMQVPALEAARAGVPEVAQPPIPRAPPTASVPPTPEVAPAPAPSAIPEAVMQEAVGESPMERAMLPGPRQPLAITDQRVPMQPPPEVIAPEAPAAASPKFTMPEQPNVVGQAGRPPQQPDPMVEFKRTGRGLTVQPSAITRIPTAAMAGYKAGKIPGAIAGVASEVLPSNLPRPDEIASRILRGFSQR